MKHRTLYSSLKIFTVFLVILFSVNLSSASEEKAIGDTFFISGTIVDSHKEPVKEAKVKVLLNGVPQKMIVEHKEGEETETSSHGTYQLEIKLLPGQIDSSKIQLEISKTSYKKTHVDFSKEDFAQKGQKFYSVKDVSMSRVLGPAFWIASVVSAASRS